LELEALVFILHFSLGDDLSCLFNFCFFPSLALIPVLVYLYRYVGDGSYNGRIVHTTSTFPRCKVFLEFALGRCSSHLTGHYIF